MQAPVPQPPALGSNMPFTPNFANMINPAALGQGHLQGFGALASGVLSGRSLSNKAAKFQQQWNPCQQPGQQQQQGQQRPPSPEQPQQENQQQTAGQRQPRRARRQSPSDSRSRPRSQDQRPARRRQPRTPAPRQHDEEDAADEAPPARVGTRRATPCSAPALPRPVLRLEAPRVPPGPPRTPDQRPPRLVASPGVSPEASPYTFTFLDTAPSTEGAASLAASASDPLRPAGAVERAAGAAESAAAAELRDPGNVNPAQRQSQEISIATYERLLVVGGNIRDPKLPEDEFPVVPSEQPSSEMVQLLFDAVIARTSKKALVDVLVRSGSKPDSRRPSKKDMINDLIAMQAPPPGA